MNIGSKKLIKGWKQNALRRHSFLTCAKTEIAHSDFASFSSVLYWTKICVCITSTDGEEKTPGHSLPKARLQINNKVGLWTPRYVSSKQTKKQNHF